MAQMLAGGVALLLEGDWAEGPRRKPKAEGWLGVELTRNGVGE
jgi:hypothetical protein